MRVGGYGISAKLRHSSDTLGRAAERPCGACSTFEHVVIEDMQEARLSSLQNDDRLSLLATYLMHRCGVRGDLCVKYGWSKETRSIIVGIVEYQERRGRVLEFGRQAE